MHAAVGIGPQMEHTEWFRDGLKNHGIDLIISNSRNTKGDIHIVSGPNFCRNEWLDHPRVISIDRCYYHPGKSIWKSMDWISLGWLRPDGGRKFIMGSGRQKPIIKPRPKTGGTIFLADYDGPVEKADTVRLHPAKQSHTDTLEEALSRHRKAVGYQTTSLVTAALEGLEIVCKDERSILTEPDWLELLPYADWRYDEIQSGEAWEHLCQIL